MPSTGRQRYVIRATWGAATTVPASYTLHQLDAQGRTIASNDRAVDVIDMSDAGMMRVKLPAGIAAGALTLKFLDAAAANADSDADVLDFGYAQDVDGADIAVTGIQDSLGKSRRIHADLDSCFYVIPVFVDTNGDPIAPGAVTVEFLIKE